jgi:WD40 repeat protein
MIDLRAGRYALCSCIAAAMLGGCGGSQPSMGAPQTSAIATQAERGKSSSSSAYELLYATLDDGIYVLSFPGGSLEESFYGPSSFVNGLCAAPNGNVFVTGDSDSASGYIWEYAPGGTAPIATLVDAGYEPITCSVDPTTGNLAVANVYAGYNGDNVAIYTGAEGYPTFYNDSDMRGYSGCAYDNNGNLFVVGRNEDYTPQLIELPKGSGTFTSISTWRHLGEGAIPGVMQWRGNYLTVAFNAGRIYSVRVSGSTGKVIKTTHLTGAADNSQPWTQGNTAATPYKPAVHDRHAANEIALYAFPKGGKPSSIIDFGLPKNVWIHYVAIDVVPGNERRR